MGTTVTDSHFTGRAARHSSLAAIAFGGLLLTPSCSHAATSPNLLSPGPGQEFVLGEKALEDFLAARPLSTDGNLVVRVDRIGRIVSRAGDRPDLSLTFLVIEGDDLQGYSFLGGTVCITRRTVELLSADDELAFALGHEIAHIVLRHLVTRVRFEQALASQGARSAEVVSFHDRDAELEADRYGALYALRAGYRYGSARDALKKLADADKTRVEDAAHPSYAARIEAFDAYSRELERCLEAFERGKTALQKGTATDAISYFSIFVQVFPRSVTGRVDLGAAYLERLRSKSGTPQGLEESVPFLPDPGVTLRGPYDEMDLRHAEDHFSEALRLHPELSEARVGLALTRTRQGKLDEARNLLLPLTQDASPPPEAVLCLGNVEYLAQRYDAAVQRFQEALVLRPGWSDATKNLALAFEAQGKIDEAHERWTALLEDARLGGEARRWLDDHPPAP